MSDLFIADLADFPWVPPPSFDVGMMTESEQYKELLDILESNERVRKRREARRKGKVLEKRVMVWRRK